MLLHAFRIARGHLNPEFFYYPSMLFNMIGSATWLVSKFYSPHGVSLSSPVTFVTDPTPYYLIGRSRRRRLRRDLGLPRLPSRQRGLLAARRPAGGAVPGGRAAARALLARGRHRRAGDHVRPARAAAVPAGGAPAATPRTLLFGALAAGLATGTKYNLGMLFVPGVDRLLVRLSRPTVAGRRSGGPLRALRRVAAPMLLAFVVSTPFAVLDPRHFLGDFYRQNQIVANGWLGFENVHNGYWYNLSVNLRRLARGRAPGARPGRPRAGAGSNVRGPTSSSRPTCIVYYLYVSSWHALMDRYLLPIVPLLIVLAVRACAGPRRGPLVRRRAAGRRRGRAAALLLGAIVLPARASINYSRSLSGTDRAPSPWSWIEHHLPANAVIAMEPYGPPLVRRLDLAASTLASPEDADLPVYPLPLPLPRAPTPWRACGSSLAHDIAYVVLSSEVDSRVLAARAAYPAMLGFYRAVARDGDLLAAFRPRGEVRGPTVTIYRLLGELGRPPLSEPAATGSADA